VDAIGTALGALLLWATLPQAALTGTSTLAGFESTAGTATVAEIEVVVRSVSRSVRGVGDVTVGRELLEASPRAKTSELLSAAPGFFVDHEDGEGLANDVYLRGFDLDHGSGIEMSIGAIPLNIPNHIQGQGYAEVNFIIPEVVRSVRVLEGPYDARQGDAAIVGSAVFDLGVQERGYQVKTAGGSFGQARVLAIAAPEEAGEETFAAVALRTSQGFGADRAAKSGSVIAQQGFDLSGSLHLRVLGVASAAEAALPGVVRSDDVDAHRVDFYGAYPYFSAGQGVLTSRFILGAELDGTGSGGGHFELTPWVMWTRFRARQNFAGALETSQQDPALYGLGDLFETSNTETAGGLTSRYRTEVSLGELGRIAIASGIALRVGSTDQARSLLVPTTLVAWDHRFDAALSTLDGGAYLDLDAHLLRGLHLTFGMRADLLLIAIDDRLLAAQPLDATVPNASGAAQRQASGVALSPRLTAAYRIGPSLELSASYGEGFRSLDAGHLSERAQPYSKVRSGEVGLQLELFDDSADFTVAAFVTQVGNELVFEAASGGLTTENASLRRGAVGSLLLRPFDWLLVSSALSVAEATFQTSVVGVAHDVPNVPPVLIRVDATARSTLGQLEGRPVNGRIGVGYTFLAGRHLTDTLVGPANHVLNAGAGLRWGPVELSADAYNLLDLRYADDAQYYVSNWSLVPGQQPASAVTHIIAAPPLTLLGTLSLYF
jgi:outer membrane receptor protein involved in Fe transport